MRFVSLSTSYESLKPCCKVDRNQELLFSMTAADFGLKLYIKTPFLHCPAQDHHFDWNLNID